MPILLPDGHEDVHRTSIHSPENLTDEEDQNLLCIAMLQAVNSVSSLIFHNPDNGKLTLTIDLDELVAQFRSDVIGESGYRLITDVQNQLQLPTDRDRDFVQGYLFSGPSAG